MGDSFGVFLIFFISVGSDRYDAKRVKDPIRQREDMNCIFEW